MAKKAKGARGKPTPKKKKKAAARKQTTRDVTRRSRAPKPQRPKTPPLPGMEHMAADRELDQICSGIADELHAINESSETLKGLKANGLQALKKKGRAVYVGHGVRIMRVAGDEKLAAKLVKGEAQNEEAEDGDDLDNGEGDDEPDADGDLQQDDAPL